MALEMSWFAPSCRGDTARLGVDDPGRRATFAYNRRVIELVDRNVAAKGLDSGPKPEVAEEAAEA